MPDLCFVQVTDCHLTDEASAEIVRRVVPEVNRIGPDFVAFVGDLVTEGTPEEYALFRAAVADLQAPAIYVIGNHDALGLAGDGDGAGAEARKAAFAQHLGPLNAGLDFGPYHVIVLDSTQDTSITWGGGFTQPTIRWLREHLRLLPPDRPLVLLTHHGIYDEQPFAPKENLLCDALNYEAVHEALAGRRLVLACAGHAHQSARFEHNGTVYAFTTCLSTTRRTHDDQPPGYCVIRLGGGRVETEYHTVPLSEEDRDA
jgi:Icc protein